jgi:hypothetical protein
VLVWIFMNLVDRAFNGFLIRSSGLLSREGVVCRSNRTAACHDGRVDSGSHGSRPAGCPSARHFEGARPAPSCLAGPVASRRGRVHWGRCLWRYTGGHARVASNLLSLFLFFGCSVSRGYSAGFGRGLDADGNCVVVRNALRASSIPWGELAAIEFKGVDSVAISDMYCQLVFSAMTDLASRPRHPAVEQDPASTSLNSGNVCSPCDTPQLGHSLRSLRFRLRRRAS